VAKKKDLAKEKERKQAKTDYQKHLDAVMELKTMTDTPAWQAYYRMIQNEIKRHGEAVLNAEKSREVIAHQEGVKVLRSLIRRVKAPIDSLDSFIRAMPLFVGDMKMRAEWNAALGKVELRTV